MDSSGTDRGAVAYQKSGFLYGALKSVSGLSALAFAPLLVAVLLLCAVWGVTLSRITFEEQLATQNVTTNAANVAHIVASSLQGILQRAQVYADKARVQLGSGAGALNRFDLNPVRLGDRAYLRIAVFNAQGRMIYNSSRRRHEPELLKLMKREQEGASKLSADETGDLLFLSGNKGAGNNWQIPVLMPFKTTSGETGFLGGILDLGYFLGLYGEINLGEDGRVEIVCKHGHRFVRTSGRHISGGDSVAGTSFFNLISGSERGSGQVVHPDDGKMSIVVFERLQDFPLIIATSQSYESATHELVQRRIRYHWYAALLSVALVVMAAMMVLLVLRYREYYKDTIRAEKEKQNLIEALQQEKQHAYHLATHDHLTGLPNRMLFVEMASSHLLRAKRSRNLYALLFVDLDHFKMINDTYGHRVGDLLLQTVANRLRSRSRESDISARFGGDEFVMLLTEVASVQDIENIAANIVETVGAICKDLGGHDIEVHTTVGIALYPQDGTTVDDLILNADAAMYEAKSAGRNVFRFYDPTLHSYSVQQIALLQQFRRAVKSGQFTVYYQPRVSLQNWEVVGMEALVRWQHPELGLLLPGTFIEMAEAHGLIGLLGDWVLDRVGCQLSEWRQRGLETVPVAINISAMQLDDMGLVGKVRCCLENYALLSDDIEIELTESCIMKNPGQSLAVLTNLADMGIRIAIDDFGVGYSGLGYLKKLPISTIKIDRSLIQDLPGDSSDVAIVSSTIEIAKHLKLNVIAEGVETREQLVHLKANGCDEVQGFYLMRPSPAEQMVSILESGFFDIEKGIL